MWDAIAQWLRQRRSRSWPWTKSDIDTSSVETVRRGRSGRVYKLTVLYSYSVNGASYGASYTETFRTNRQAQQLRKSLKELPPPVRYNPGDPSKSVMNPYRDGTLGLRRQ